MGCKPYIRKDSELGKQLGLKSNVLLEDYITSAVIQPGSLPLDIGGDSQSPLSFSVGKSEYTFENGVFKNAKTSQVLKEGTPRYREVKKSFEEQKPQLEAQIEESKLSEVKAAASRSFEETKVRVEAEGGNKLKNLKAVEAGMKAVSKILPNLKFNIYETSDAYVEASSDKEIAKREKGAYTNGTVSFNLEKMTPTTVVHEIFHAFIKETVGKGNYGKSELQSNLKDVLKDLVSYSGSKGLIKRFKAIESSWEKDQSDPAAMEEQLTEMIEFMSSEFASVPKSLKVKIQKLANSFINLVSPLFKKAGVELKKFDTFEETATFLSNFAKDVRRGEEVKTSEEFSRRIAVSGKKGSKTVEALPTTEDTSLNGRRSSAKGIKGATDEELAKLSVAEEKFKVGVDMLTIKRAYGWEYHNGDWKLEVDPPKLDFDKLKEETESNGYAFIDEVASGVDDLVKSYPKLKSLQIVAEDLGDEEGYYDPNTITIGINFKAKDPKQTFVHEIQHLIQLEEGWPIGADAKKIVDALPTETLVAEAKNIKSNLSKVVKGTNKELGNVGNVLSEADLTDQAELFKAWKDTGDRKDYAKLLKSLKSLSVGNYFYGPNIKEFLQRGKTLESSLRDYESTLKTYVSSVEAELSKAETFLKDKNEAKFKDFLNSFVSDDTKYDYYWRMAGEVEARNVAYRSTLSPEQRRNTLLKETQSVDEIDQINIRRSSLQKDFPKVVNSISNSLSESGKLFEARTPEQGTLVTHPRQFVKTGFAKIGRATLSQILGNKYKLYIHSQNSMLNVLENKVNSGEITPEQAVNTISYFDGENFHILFFASEAEYTEGILQPFISSKMTDEDLVKLHDELKKISKSPALKKQPREAVISYMAEIINKKAIQKSVLSKLLDKFLTSIGIKNSEVYTNDPYGILNDIIDSFVNDRVYKLIYKDGTKPISKTNRESDFVSALTNDIVVAYIYSYKGKAYEKLSEYASTLGFNLSASDIEGFLPLPAKKAKKLDIDGTIAALWKKTPIEVKRALEVQYGDKLATTLKLTERNILQWYASLELTVDQKLALVGTDWTKETYGESTVDVMKDLAYDEFGIRPSTATKDQLDKFAPKLLKILDKQGLLPKGLTKNVTLNPTTSIVYLSILDDFILAFSKFENVMTPEQREEQIQRFEIRSHIASTSGRVLAHFSKHNSDITAAELRFKYWKEAYGNMSAADRAVVDEIVELLKVSPDELTDVIKNLKVRKVQKTITPEVREAARASEEHLEIIKNLYSKFNLEHTRQWFSAITGLPLGNEEFVNVVNSAEFISFKKNRDIEVGSQIQNMLKEFKPEYLKTPLGWFVRRLMHQILPQATVNIIFSESDYNVLSGPVKNSFDSYRKKSMQFYNSFNAGDINLTELKKGVRDINNEMTAKWEKNYPQFTPPLFSVDWNSLPALEASVNLNGKTYVFGAFGSKHMWGLEGNPVPNQDEIHEAYYRDKTNQSYINKVSKEVKLRIKNKKPIFSNEDLQKAYYIHSRSLTRDYHDLALVQDAIFKFTGVEMVPGVSNRVNGYFGDTNSIELISQAYQGKTTRSVSDLLMEGYDYTEEEATAISSDLMTAIEPLWESRKNDISDLLDLKVKKYTLGKIREMMKSGNIIKYDVAMAVARKNDMFYLNSLELNEFKTLLSKYENAMLKDDRNRAFNEIKTFITDHRHRSGVVELIETLKGLIYTAMLNAFRTFGTAFVGTTVDSIEQIFSGTLGVLLTQIRRGKGKEKLDGYKVILEALKWGTKGLVTKGIPEAFNVIITGENTGKYTSIDVRNIKKTEGDKFAYEYYNETIAGFINQFKKGNQHLGAGALKAGLNLGKFILMTVPAILVRAKVGAVLGDIIPKSFNKEYQVVIKTYFDKIAKGDSSLSNFLSEINEVMGEGTEMREIYEEEAARYEYNHSKKMSKLAKNSRRVELARSFEDENLRERAEYLSSIPALINPPRSYFGALNNYLTNAISLGEKNSKYVAVDALKSGAGLIVSILIPFVLKVGTNAVINTWEIMGGNYLTAAGYGTAKVSRKVVEKGYEYLRGGVAGPSFKEGKTVLGAIEQFLNPNIRVTSDEWGPGRKISAIKRQEKDLHEKLGFYTKGILGVLVYAVAAMSAFDFDWDDDKDILTISYKKPPKFLPMGNAGKNFTKMSSTLPGVIPGYMHKWDGEKYVPLFDMTKYPLIQGMILPYTVMSDLILFSGEGTKEEGTLRKTQFKGPNAFVALGNMLGSIYSSSIGKMLNSSGGVFSEQVSDMAKIFTEIIDGNDTDNDTSKPSFRRGAISAIEMGWQKAQKTMMSVVSGGALTKDVSTWIDNSPSTAASDVMKEWQYRAPFWYWLDKKTIIKHPFLMQSMKNALDIPDYNDSEEKLFDWATKGYYPYRLNNYGIPDVRKVAITGIPAFDRAFNSDETSNAAKDFITRYPLVTLPSYKPNYFSLALTTNEKNPVAKVIVPQIQKQMFAALFDTNINSLNEMEESIEIGYPGVTSTPLPGQPGRTTAEQTLAQQKVDAVRQQSIDNAQVIYFLGAYNAFAKSNGIEPLDINDFVKPKPKDPSANYLLGPRLDLTKFKHHLARNAAEEFVKANPDKFKNFIGEGGNKVMVVFDAKNNIIPSVGTKNIYAEAYADADGVYYNPESNKFGAIDISGATVGKGVNYKLDLDVLNFEINSILFELSKEFK